MGLRRLATMALLIVFVDYMGACVSLTRPTESITLEFPPDQPALEKKREFHQQVETRIPIDVPEGNVELVADVFRPLKKTQPKTLIIIAPGSGNVSRRGEVSGDGIDSYEAPLDMSLQWAKALSDNGFFVLSYDKRTCNARINSICRSNDQRDVDQDGILALAKDLDQVYLFAEAKLGIEKDRARIVLFSTTQGAQAIAMSLCKKKASGIVLLSPIVSDLETMWVGGLEFASANTRNKSKQNRLVNQKESMSAFFASLKDGKFPEDGNIRGASVKFWQSWILASKDTLPELSKNNLPTLMLFSKKDSFSSDSFLGNIRKQYSSNRNLTIKVLPLVDRNFVDSDGVPETALKEVVSFIERLPAISI